LGTTSVSPVRAAAAPRVLSAASWGAADGQGRAKNVPTEGEITRLLDAARGALSEAAGTAWAWGGLSPIEVVPPA